MDPSTARTPEMRARWKEALEGCLGKQLGLPIDEEIFTVDAHNHPIMLDGLYVVNYKAGNIICCMALPRMGASCAICTVLQAQFVCACQPATGALRSALQAGLHAALEHEVSGIRDIGTAANLRQPVAMISTANTERREAAAAQHSASSGTRTRPAAENATVQPSSRAEVRGTARDQSPSSSEAAGSGSARGGSQGGGRGGGGSGSSFGASLGVSRKQDVVRAAAASGGQCATDPSSSNVTAGLEWVQRPLSRSSSSGVSSEGQQVGPDGTSNSDSSGRAPGSSSGGGSSSAGISSGGGTGSCAKTAAFSAPLTFLAEVQSTQVNCCIVFELSVPKRVRAISSSRLEVA